MSHDNPYISSVGDSFILIVWKPLLESNTLFADRARNHIAFLFLSLLTRNTKQILMLDDSFSDDDKMTKIASFKANP